MLPEQIIFVGVLISAIGAFLYLKEIVFGSTRPNLVSHSIWALAPLIGVFFQIKAGAGLSFLPIFTAGIISILIILFSLIKKNGYWKINNFDIVCGIISLTALILYIFTRNLGVSILFAIASDALAYFPTIKKTWSYPETEASSIYITGILSNIIGLLTIQLWSFPIYSFSISIIFFDCVVIFAIFKKKFFKKVIFS